jgi:hypothetical protein
LAKSTSETDNVDFERLAIALDCFVNNFVYNYIQLLINFKQNTQKKQQLWHLIIVGRRVCNVV